MAISASFAVLFFIRLQTPQPPRQHPRFLPLELPPSGNNALLILSVKRKRDVGVGYWHWAWRGDDGRA